MNRWEAWLLHLSTIGLGITGLAYAWMRYMMEPIDPFSVVNHPLEPHMLSLHILLAPALILGFGLILHGHILFKIASGSRTARRSGIILIPTFVIMVLSGYLLQVITSEFRKILVIAHLGSGAVWLLFYAGHQIASYSLRRARLQEKSLRYPVQVLLIALLLMSPQKLMAETFERQVYTMGTTLRVVMLEENRQKALQQSEALIREIERTENQLSTWKSGSELSLLNGADTGKPFSVTPDVFRLLEQLKIWAERTEHAFDPAIGELIQAWAIHGEFRIPTKDEISRALRNSGTQHLHLNECDLTVTKTRKLQIDPGAFGKGEALDRALAIAAAQKMAPLLLDFGGQIAVYGAPETQQGWITHVSNAKERFRYPVEILRLNAGSLSTSGFSERSGQVAGKQINHILNPATGMPASQFGSVTVWHEEALVADILSTALYVMGPKKGYRWAVKNGIAAAFVSGESVLKSPAFLRVFASLR